MDRWMRYFLEIPSRISLTTALMSRSIGELYRDNCMKVWLHNIFRNCFVCTCTSTVTVAASLSTSLWTVRRTPFWLHNQKSWFTCFDNRGGLYAGFYLTRIPNKFFNSRLLISMRFSVCTMVSCLRLHLENGLCPINKRSMYLLTKFQFTISKIRASK